MLKLLQCFIHFLTLIILQNLFYFSDDSVHYYYEMKILKHNNQYNKIFIELSVKEFPCIMDYREREHLTHCIVCDSNIKIFHRGDIKEHFDATGIQIFVYKKNHITFFVAYIFKVTCF